jgi:tRNA threonylcarbamoyladenosine biosynthesis protein TsaE
MMRILEVGAECADEVLELIHGSFAGRPELDPPATALEETRETVAEALAAYGGLLATVDDEPVGTLLFRPEGRLLRLRRVGVLASARRHGVGPHLGARATAYAVGHGYRGLVLEARAELPDTVRFWQRQGFVEVDRDGPRLTMALLLPATFTLPTADDTRALGGQVAGLLQRSDLLVLTGDLGAGKTTFTQGLGEGLGVRGNVTSPTFVIARVHPSLAEGPELVHVDAYRLGDTAELDDLDLDTDLDQAVTVVEWGAGLAEALATDRLEVRVERAAGNDSGEVRTVTLTPVGPRWFDVDLARLPS